MSIPHRHEWLSATATAKALCVHHSTIVAWCLRGYLRSARTPGPRGTFRIPLDEVERLRRETLPPPPAS